MKEREVLREAAAAEGAADSEHCFVPHTARNLKIRKAPKGRV
jgi:hypothetical protein